MNSNSKDIVQTTWWYHEELSRKSSLRYPFASSSGKKLAEPIFHPSKYNCRGITDFLLSSICPLKSGNSKVYPSYNDQISLIPRYRKNLALWLTRWKLKFWTGNQVDMLLVCVCVKKRRLNKYRPWEGPKKDV